MPVVPMELSFLVTSLEETFFSGDLLNGLLLSMSIFFLDKPPAAVSAQMSFE